LAFFGRGYGVTAEQTRAVAITFSSVLFWLRLILGLGKLGGRALFYYAVMSQQPCF
ncbi:MAG: hypothetical protein PWQ18_802, partial [Clostridia bacterium]|nr:hypothetical protein [Clostridia bacterium]